MGVAAAANLAAVTVGTETGGSIMCPSSITGVVGVKPTVGLSSRAGIIPISHSQDSAGPMTRTVRDAAILLGIACGVDARDPATARSQGRFHADYTTFLDPAGLKGARLGIVRNIPGFDERVVRLFDEAIAAMKSAGADVVDPANLPHMEAGSVFQDLPIVVLNYEFKANINRYFQSLGPDAKIKTLADLIRFNEEHRDREMPFFGQERLIMSEATGSLDDPEYRKAAETIQRMSRADGIDAMMARFRLDALVAPTAAPGWLIDHVRGDRFDGGDSAGTAAIAGYPDITVPMGFVAGLPVGVSFFGRAWSEPTLSGLPTPTSRRRSAGSRQPTCRRSGESRSLDLTRNRLAHVVRQRHRGAPGGIETDLHGLLGRAVGHGIGFVEAHFVGERLAADPREPARHHDQLPGGELVMEIYGEAGDDAAEPAPTEIAERHAGASQDVPAGLVEHRRVVADVHVPVGVAVRRHHDGPMQLVPARRHARRRAHFTTTAGTLRSRIRRLNAFKSSPKSAAAIRCCCAHCSDKSPRRSRWPSVGPASLPSMACAGR